MYKLFIALFVDGDTISEIDEFDTDHTFYLLVGLSFENETFMFIVLCLIIFGDLSFKKRKEWKGCIHRVYLPTVI